MSNISTDKRAREPTQRASTHQKVPYTSISCSCLKQALLLSGKLCADEIKVSSWSEHLELLRYPPVWTRRRERVPAPRRRLHQMRWSLKRTGAAFTLPLEFTASVWGRVKLLVFPNVRTYKVAFTESLKWKRFFFLKTRNLTIHTERFDTT